MKAPTVTRILMGCGVALGTFASVAPAHAFTFGTGTVGVSTANVGQSFTINFNGNVSTQNVPGLTSQATFTLNSFTSGQANFTVSLLNTSSLGITSRTSALGFNVSQPFTATQPTGLFTKAVTGGSFPNQFGPINVCFTNGNTCQGGANGGVSTGNPAQSFSFALNMANNTTNFTLSNFGVRYQSITGTALGSSGTGSGTPFTPPPPPPPQNPERVPEPGMVGALALTGLVASRFRKRNQATA